VPFRSAPINRSVDEKTHPFDFNNHPLGRSFFGARATSLALVVVEEGQEQKMNRNDALIEKTEEFSTSEKTLVYSFLLMVVLVAGLLITS
jgi:hypothetical protein